MHVIDYDFLTDFITSCKILDPLFQNFRDLIMNIYKHLNIFDLPFLCINLTLVAVDCLNIEMIKKTKILSKHCI